MKLNERFQMNNRDLQNFNKLPVKQQNAITEKFIKTFPKEQQAQMRKELLI